MASLPLANWSAPADRLLSPPARPLPIINMPARLSALEWSIVAIAERDSLSSLREPGRLLSALGNLFGVRRVRRLANDRLETLRRVAVLAWHHRWNVPKSELRAFFDVGFSPDQYELVQASIASARAETAKRGAR